MIRRAEFLTAAAAFALAPRIAAAQSEEYDPATGSSTQMLRVLLGAGTALPAPSGFTFQGRPYRGSFSHTPAGDVVNVVNLEEYLYSVVPREMPASWPAAALQAQAMCARTYVLQRSNPRRDYDVVPGEADQVYTGVNGESPAARAAVDATAGTVLRYRGEFASIMYSSCCGGHTESPAFAWQGGVAIPYLGGVPCGYCTASPNYRWQRDVTLADIGARFARELAAVGVPRGVRIGAIDPSGRVETMQLDAERGTVEVRGGAFRAAMGGRAIPSLLLTRVTPAPDAPAPSVHIEGGGLGHGVGLCQWGARGMALAGKSAREVIAFYFPGTDLGHD